MHPKDAEGVANSVEPNQTAQSDLSLHCLPRPIWKLGIITVVTCTVAIIAEYTTQNLLSINLETCGSIANHVSNLCYRYVTQSFFYKHDNFWWSYCNVSKFSDRQVLSKQCRSRSDSLIRVYTVCHSICIVWMHFSMKNPYESNFRIITVYFSSVRMFRSFTVAPGRMS